MIANAVVVLSLVLNAWASAAVTSDPAFRRHAAVKALGYDPETPGDLCQVNAHTPIAARLIIGNESDDDSDVVRFLRASGELGAELAACPKAAARNRVLPFVGPGGTLMASVCVAAAEGAGGKITAHISEMMNTEHPDVVAGYVDGVARALEPIRDACKDAGDESWAKVAAQAALFENRARSIRDSRVCTLWRLAVDREAKAATAIGGQRGRVAGLAHLRVQAGAAMAGAHHYCGADASAGVIDANFELTKMLIESMGEK